MKGQPGAKVLDCKSEPIYNVRNYIQLALSAIPLGTALA